MEGTSSLKIKMKKILMIIKLKKDMKTNNYETA